jgi:hypothetical protein
MRTFLPLCLFLAVATWFFASQDLTAVTAGQRTGPQYEDGTDILPPPPPPPPPGPKQQ